MTRREFTPDEHRTITMLIADECPPGEIAATIGVSTSLITSRYPEAKGTREQLKEWLSLRAFQTKCEASYDKRTDAPKLGRSTGSLGKMQPQPDAIVKSTKRRGPERHHWSDSDLATAEQMLRDGASYNRVAERIGVARRTIQKRFPGYGHPAKRKAEAA